MKKIFVIAMVVFAGFIANAQYLTQGFVFTNGARLTAEQLGYLVNNAVVNPYLITHQSSAFSGNSSDSFLFVRSGSFYKISLDAMLYTNTALIGSRTLSTSPSLQSEWMFYDPTNTINYRVTFSNLVARINPILSPAYIRYSSTNSGSNQPVLADWPHTLSAYATNNQATMLAWTTNGIPYGLSFSNLIVSSASDLGTKALLPYTYNQMFYPWTVYSTNYTTNYWGETNVFPIVSIYSGGVTNPTTISTNDTIPLNSTLQGSNTTMTVGALLEYVAYKNTLPPYTAARINFDGVDRYYNFIVSNGVSTVAGITPNPFTSNTVTCFSVMTNKWAFDLPNITTNTPYFGVSTGQSTPTNAFLAFTSYLDANNYIQGVSTNAVVYSSASLVTNSINIISTHSSFNCDVIGSYPGNSTNSTAGVYKLFFRTPMASTNYYLSGSVQFDASDDDTATINIQPRPILTNTCTIATHLHDAKAIFSRVMVLISPE